MSVKIDLPLGYVFRAFINDGLRTVVGVHSENDDSCVGCAFIGSGDCPIACCKQDRLDATNCIFVEVVDGKGGAE